MSGAPSTGRPQGGGSAQSNRRTQLTVLGVSPRSSSSWRSSSASPARTTRLRRVGRRRDRLGGGRPRGNPPGGRLPGRGRRPVVTEFVDLQCPFCAEFSTNAFNDVVEQHVRPGDVLYELRVISFLGEDSGVAAEMAAAAALQNRLYEFTDDLLPQPGRGELRLRDRGVPGRDRREDAGPRRRTGAGGPRQPRGAGAGGRERGQGDRAGVNSTPTFLLSEGGEPTELQLSDLTPDAFTQALAAARGG